MKHYNIKVEDVLKKLNSSNKGLTNEEVIKRSADGKNVLDAKPAKSNFVKFLAQFKDLMVIILLIAAIISFTTALIEGESLIEGFIIIVIVILNALLGFVQENKADKAIEALNAISKPDVRVRRNNEIKKINIEDIVVGDVLVLEAGDYIPADCRVISSISLKVDEASLTGESESVLKSIEKLKDDTVLNERINMLYSGSNVVYGKGEAVVAAIGMNTELGKIAKTLIEEDGKSTPLQKKIDNISKILTIAIGLIIIVMFSLGVSLGNEVLDMFIISISLAVAAIPEGLPAVITITLSLGMTSLAKENAIVRKISSVETLGSTEVICSDKTGTITQNKMTVRQFMIDNTLTTEIDDELFINVLLLCNDVVKSGNEYLGDPTEIALVNYCESKKININKYLKEHKRLKEFPFDSERKLMTTINEVAGKKLVLTKGSIDSLLPKCSKSYINGKVVKDIDKKVIKKLEKESAANAYRILGLAYKEVKDESKVTLENAEDNLIFIGFVCMIDPPRENVLNSINTCYKAGIKPVMITGDSIDTAIAIAKEVGIYKENDKAIEGFELEKMSDKDLIKNVHKYSVYARVSPEHKLRIVKAWQDNNKIVAMTGDGVNDAPAIKTSDVGIGMGITGTEVSKNVSDIVLTDDSFNTIIVAIKEGRNIFENIRKSITYLLTANLAEVIIVFFSTLFGTYIFLPIHLLYINLVTDSLPAIALSFEKNDDDIMSRKTRENKNSLFTPFITSRVIYSAVVKSLFILLLFYSSVNKFGENQATTMAFLGLILLEMTYAVTCRDLHKSIFNKNFFSNKQMNYTMLFLTVLQIIVFATPLGTLFEIVPLAFNEVMYILLFVLIVVVLNETSKTMLKKSFKDE